MGGGTGMTCYDWKGGIGTPSQTVSVLRVDSPYKKISKTPYTVGRAGAGKSGQLLGYDDPGLPLEPSRALSRRNGGLPARDRDSTGTQELYHCRHRDGCAGLSPNQLETPWPVAPGSESLAPEPLRMMTPAKSDRISTANQDAWIDDRLATALFIPNNNIDPLFEATVQATEEAIIDAFDCRENPPAEMASNGHGITDGDESFVGRPHEEIQDAGTRRQNPRGATKKRLA